MVVRQQLVRATTPTCPSPCRLQLQQRILELVGRSTESSENLARYASTRISGCKKGKMTKLMLVLMVKNESAILQRCYESVTPFVDEVLIADTGSTDNTRELARSLGAKVVEEPWQNFGYNRTESLKAARTWAAELGWDLGRSYALVIDADMVLRGSPEALRAALSEMNPSGRTSYRKTAISSTPIRE